MVQARLAIAKSFLEAYSRLPKKQQKKVREFTERWPQPQVAEYLEEVREFVARDLDRWVTPEEEQGTAETDVTTHEAATSIASAATTKRNFLPTTSCSRTRR